MGSNFTPSVTVKMKRISNRRRKLHSYDSPSASNSDQGSLSNKMDNTLVPSTNNYNSMIECQSLVSSQRGSIDMKNYNYSVYNNDINIEAICFPQVLLLRIYLIHTNLVSP